MKDIFTKMLIFALAMIGVAGNTGCTKQVTDYRLTRDSEKLRRATPPFNPAYFKEQEQKHLAVFFDIVNGHIRPSQRAAETRPGRMPYRSRTSGNAVIVYRGEGGEELGRYAAEDPVILRSCDTEAGPSGEVRQITKGTIEILLPYNPAIKEIEIVRKGKEPEAYEISEQLEQLGRSKQEIERVK